VADHDQDIEAVEMPFAEALAMVDDGRIADAKTIMLLTAVGRVGLEEAVTASSPSPGVVAGRWGQVLPARRRRQVQAPS
jgi:hypothetical protein